MATAMASELTGRPVRGDIAMTGEITLSGRVLPVGGIKEKVLAARRVGIREVILPKQNAKNVNEDLTPELRQDLTVHLVSTIDEVLALALQPVSSDVRPQKTEPRAAEASPRAAAPADRRQRRSLQLGELALIVVYSPAIASISGCTSFPPQKYQLVRDARLPRAGRRSGRPTSSSRSRRAGTSSRSFTRPNTSTSMRDGHAVARGHRAARAAVVGRRWSRAFG